MSISAEKLPAKANCFENIFDWMKSRFDGDMDKLTSETMKHIKKQQYVFGPLWDEIGERTLRLFFREQLRNERSFGAGSMNDLNALVELKAASSIKQNNGEGDAKRCLENQGCRANPSPVSVYLTWHCAGKVWIQLGDMTKADCLLLAQDYMDRAKSNRENGLFFAELSNRLNDRQIVKETLREDEVLQIMASVKNQG